MWILILANLKPYLLKLLPGAVLCAFAASSFSENVSTPDQARIENAVYTNAISNGAWNSRSSVFSCTLEHEVPYYGKAIFRTRAGEKSAFMLSEKSSRFEPGAADIVALSPAWKTEKTREELGSAPAKRGRNPMWLDSEWAEQLLLTLYEGRELEISQKAWYQKNAKERTRLVITPIGFRPAYDNYLRCLKGLLVANYDQVKRSAIYFPEGEIEEIPEPEVSKLDRILDIVKHDKSVRAFFIDGHTDSEGSRAENLEISKVRAEMVSDYLKRRGIPEDWITIRWHGERYPVSANASAAGKAKNRRVTVRVERVEEVEVLPLESEQAE